MSVVQDAYGPTLPELLRRLPRAARVALAVGVAAIVLAAVVLAAGRGGGGHTVVVDRPVAFNLQYGGRLRRVRDHGALVHLETRRSGRFVQSYVVRALHLPPYRGDVNGVLPLYASGELTRLAARYPALQPTNEGRIKVDVANGYDVQFRTRVEGHVALGRHILVLPDRPGARDGVILELLARSGPTVRATDDVGTVGALKKPLRSFRFGTAQ
jgi:hypothetical protein